MPRRLIIGMSGASGAIYGIRMLEVLREVPDLETHLVMSGPARQTIALETKLELGAVRALADRSYHINDMAAEIASGSYQTHGMVIIPCSIRTLAGVAYSLSDNLLLRAADVMLKERRPLVLVVRETPLHLGHLRLMAQVAELGVSSCRRYRRSTSVLSHLMILSIRRSIESLTSLGSPYR